MSDLEDFVICFYRKLRKYRIFAGLWFGDTKPQMRTFLNPFVSELQELESKGIFYSILISIF